MNVPARIVIADDHHMVRHAIRHFVETYRDLKVIGEACNGARAVDLARELRPHIILMDVHMPVMDGSEAAKVIRRDLPDVKVIGISVDPDMGPPMCEAGACACVQKPDLATELYPAVCTAMASVSPNSGRFQVSKSLNCCVHLHVRLLSEHRYELYPPARVF